MSKSFLQESFHTEKSTPVVNFVDRPCGYGKTSDMLEELRPEEIYLIVVPSNEEVERVKQARPDLGFVSPVKDEHGTKSRHLKDLIRSRENVVCTHALYHLNVEFYRGEWLRNYNVIIDEVLDVVRDLPGPTKQSWEEFYLGNGYATVDEDGRVRPTDKWRDRVQTVGDTLWPVLFEKAESGCLFRHNDSIFLWAVSPYLLKAGKTCTVLSFKVEGSIMARYLEKMGISYTIQRYEGEEEKFRKSFRELATVVPLDVGMKLSYTGQTQRNSLAKRAGVAKRLKKTKERQLREVFRNSKGVLVTCAKENWFSRPDDKTRPNGPFAKGSRLSETAIWLVTCPPKPPSF
jgi:hypothetical protein